MCETVIVYTAKHSICGPCPLSLSLNSTLSLTHCTTALSSLYDFISMDLCWFFRSSMANFLAQFQTIKNTSDRLVISGISLLFSSLRSLPEDPISFIPSKHCPNSQSRTSAPFRSAFFLATNFKSQCRVLVVFHCKLFFWLVILVLPIVVDVNHQNEMKF